MIAIISKKMILHACLYKYYQSIRSPHIFATDLNPRLRANGSRHELMAIVDFLVGAVNSVHSHTWTESIKHISDHSPNCKWLDHSSHCEAQTMNYLSYELDCDEH